jgi:hypothetical protein
MTEFIAIIQAAAIVFVAWGAYLCFARRDRRRYNRSVFVHPRRRKSDRSGVQEARVVEIFDASGNGATDFTIGYRRSDKSERRAA